MAHGNSIRKLFNKLIGKPANDNSNRFKFDVHPEQRFRAGDPPVDNNVVDMLHGIPVSDPFRPLEKLDHPGTTAWLKKQQEKFQKHIAANAETVEKTSAFLNDAMNYDSASMPAKHGDFYFRSFQKALAPQGTVEMARDENGPWTTILDPNSLSADGTVALSGWTPSADGKRIVYLTSASGSDVQTLHIFNTETGETMPDKIENCRFTGVLWDRKSNAGFQYTYPAHDGMRRTLVKHHTIGQPVDQDATVHEVVSADTFLSPSRLKTAQYDWMWHSIGTDKNSGLSYRPFGSQEAFKEIVPPRAYTLSPIAELADGAVLAVTNKDAPRGKLVKFNPADPAPENWTTVIEQHATDILDSAMLHQEKLFAFYSHDTADAIRVHTPEGQHLHDVPLPVQSVAAFGKIGENDKTIRMKVSGFQSAGDYYSYDIDKNELVMTAKGPAKYDMNDCIVERVHATSKDGTKVPMTIIRHPDTKLDGSAAVKLYGYGGFNVPLNPGFANSILHFVKSGGIYVQSNLRGGGEFGEDWYNQGRLANKQNVFDDFIACAEYLIDKKYTDNSRLVINGGSNGGLLTAATMLQRPDLFGAVVTEVPVTDMFRFQLGTYGSAWKSDYGDPSVKADFNNAARYSPLHNVKFKAKYPPHLIKTAEQDDRVLPWHAFKLAATLMARSDYSNVTLLRVESKAGHGAGMSTQKYINSYAETFAFIESAIGPVNQAEYKAKLLAEKQARKDFKKAQRQRPLKEKIKAIGRTLKKLDPRNLHP